MDVIETTAGCRTLLDSARAAGRTVGLVPTMGALHEGHRSLLAAARDRCGFVAMTLFVNPLQFGQAGDLLAYPRTLEADLEVAERAGCDVVFQPAVPEMYPAGEPEVTVDPGPLADRLEGAERPGHFDGVATVVAKLFAAAGPCRAYFGLKDFQQLAVVRRMACDLCLPVDVVGCPIVREPDGLALSSRNVRLSDTERSAAQALSRALAAGRSAVVAGERDGAAVRNAMCAVTDQEPLVDLDYAVAVDATTLDEVTTIADPSTVRLLIAATVGPVRLIDNSAATTLDDHNEQPSAITNAHVSLERIG